MKKIMHILILSCKKATELMEKKSVTSLSIHEKLQLKMHTAMCGACAAYEKQSKMIDEILHRHFHDNNAHQQEYLADTTFKEKIISNIQ
jgi:hypothetical protein